MRENRTTDAFGFYEETNLQKIVDEQVWKMQKRIDEAMLDKAAGTLAKYGYVKVNTEPGRCMMISETESLLWEMVGALDVADATDAKKMPIVAEYAKRIAATLGTEPPYGELLRCLENDWHISVSWDGLRKCWCIELTEEGVKLRDAAHGTLTAEQVRKVLLLHLPHREYYSVEQTDAWQAIADELNAELESGTCRIESEFRHDYGGEGSDTYEFVLSCGHSIEWLNSEPPRRCPDCGKVVRR